MGKKISLPRLWGTTHQSQTYGNSIDRSVVDIFARFLCNTSSINSIYSSNHTLEKLKLHPVQWHWRGDLAHLLHLNRSTNKSHVAIKKILNFHPNIDMAPFFEWNTEGEGERDLKALPFVIAWFERAGEAVAGDEGEDSYNIDKRKLSAIYQFAQAMPLLFVLSGHCCLYLLLIFLICSVYATTVCTCFTYQRRE